MKGCATNYPKKVVFTEGYLNPNLDVLTISPLKRYNDAMSAFEGYQRSKPIEPHNGLDGSRMSFNEGPSDVEVAAYSAIAIVVFFFMFWLLVIKTRHLINMASAKMPDSDIGDDIKLKEET